MNLYELDPEYERKDSDTIGGEVFQALQGTAQGVLQALQGTAQGVLQAGPTQGVQS